ncbi:MAG: decaprenyl-phosphate phosphoribosyltransferase [Myxococcota bacterium]
MAELPFRTQVPSRSPDAGPRSLALALLSLARPRQWIKNLLLYAALVFAERLFDATALALATLGFATFCLASSSVYLINDVIDAERDRLHPDKRRRPIAAGDVSEAAAALLAGLLTAASLALSFWIAPGFGFSVVTYLALSHFYTLVGKNIVILDVMLIASGFVIRAVAGALAIGVPSSDWFILCTLFLAMFLALSKRKAEILALEDGASRHRPVLGLYTAPALSAFTDTSMAALLISYALYVLNVHRGAAVPLALTVPFVLFGVFRYYLLVETAQLGEKPEEVLLRDRPLQVCLLGFTAVAVAALYLSR